MLVIRVYTSYDVMQIMGGVKSSISARMGGFMEDFTLSDMHLLGNEVLDAQHRVIFSNMAKVYGYLLEDKKDKNLLEALDMLDAYCKLHFFEEERIMTDMDFPRVEDHKAQHVLFVRHLEVFMGRYEEMNCAKNIDELNFLKGWFLEHIMAFDKVYGEQLRQSNQAAPVHPNT